MRQVVELGQQNNALLLVGIGARQERNGLIGAAGVDGQLRDPGRDVEEVALRRPGRIGQSVAVPSEDLTLPNVDDRLVRRVEVGPWRGRRAGF
jgi:hypothetical protein